MPKDAVKRNLLIAFLIIAAMFLGYVVGFFVGHGVGKAQMNRVWERYESNRLKK